MLKKEDAARRETGRQKLEEIDALLMIETEPIRRALRRSDEVPVRVRALLMAMEELRRRYRRSWLLLHLLYFESVEPDEIVERSGGRITKEQLRKDKSRALSRLRKILEAFPEFEF
ncbi:MAG: hypothetical protein M1548_00040 [Actinobacteria bacterium]|nr:hypothetical protein [Actinomycetota bacterium]